MCKLKVRVIANCNFLNRLGLQSTVADPGCSSQFPGPGSRIRLFLSRIPDPELTRSRIPIRIKKNLSIYNPKKDTKQCCGFGSGSRITDSVTFWPKDPGSGMGKRSESGIRIRDAQSRSYFRKIRTIIWVKILNSFMRNRDPGSGIEKILIRDKHPGSAILTLSSQKYGFGIKKCSVF
jgi:hypothetical protein